MRLGSRFRNWWDASLQRRLLLSNVATVVFFLLILGPVALLVGTANLQRQVEEGHRRLAVLVAKNINAQYGNTVETVELLRRRLEAAAGSPAAQARAMMDLRLASPLTYRALYLFDATGDLLVSVAGPVEELAARPIEESIAPPRAQAPDGVLDAYRQTGAGGMFTSPVQIVGADRIPVLHLGMPLAGEDGQVLVVKVDLRSLWQRVDEVYAGQTGRALVVSRDGVIIAHPDRAYIGEPLPPPLRPVLDGYEEQATYTDPLGGRVMLAAYSPVGKQSGWGIVVEQEYAQALAPLRTIALATFGILLVAAVMATVVTILVGRGIVRPLQTLESATQAIARTGKIDRRVAVGRRDEVGRLADAFDRMLASLRERERWYQALAEHAPVGIWQAGPDGDWQYVNPRLIEITGLTAEAAQGAGWLAALHPEDREVIADVWSAFVAGAAPYHTTYRFQHPGGAVRWVIGRASPTHAAEGEPLGFIGTLTDITERKRVEEALQQRTAQIRLLFEAGQRLGQSLDLETIFGAVHDLISQTMTCDGLVVSSYGQEDNLIRCAAMYHEGGPLEVSEFPPIPLEPEGKGTQSIAIRTGESLILADYQQHRRTAQTAYYVDEEGIINHDQAPADVEITRSALIAPLKSAGRVIGVVQVFSYRVDDFTADDLVLLEALAPQIAAAMTNALLYRQAQREIDERKRAKEALREYREQLEELVETRTAELNERVAEVEQLNRGMVNLTEDLQASHHNLEKTAKKLQEVNKELADFAYVVSHDLKAPLRAVTQLAGWIATDYADALDKDGREMVHLLIGRAKRMHNLIEGILQYSRIGRVKEREKEVDLDWIVQDAVEMLAPPDNIQITIEDELPVVVGEQTRLKQVFQNLLSNAIKFMDKPEGRVRIGCADEGTRWLFSVADNGPGIEELYHDKVFQMFQTLVPRDQVESTGVGLALVKKIVETWGGKVWVESTVGVGSTFYFTLPKK